MQRAVGVNVFCSLQISTLVLAIVRFKNKLVCLWRQSWQLLRRHADHNDDLDGGGGGGGGGGDDDDDDDDDDGGGGGGGDDDDDSLSPSSLFYTMLAPRVSVLTPVHAARP